jgi:hypothetical protein
MWKTALAAAAILALVGAGFVAYRSRDGGPRTREVIEAALKASSWEGVFPAREGGKDCTIYGGGPAPGAPYETTCRTRVEWRDDGSARVLFTHLIDGPHTWVYAVSPSLHVRFVRDFGRGAAPESQA